LQFDAAPIATSIPFFVNGTELLSLKSCSAICGGAARHRQGRRSMVGV
jgi:hypothetical protein